MILFFEGTFGNSSSRIARTSSQTKMTKNARQFLLNEVLTYYQHTIAPELYCLGVRSEPFILLIEELAQEISPKATLSEEQQRSFLEQLLDLGVAMFESDRPRDLQVYKMKLKRYLESCCNQVSL